MTNQILDAEFTVVTTASNNLPAVVRDETPNQRKARLAAERAKARRERKAAERAEREAAARAEAEKVAEARKTMVRGAFHIGGAKESVIRALMEVGTVTEADRDAFMVAYFAGKLYPDAAEMTAEMEAEAKRIIKLPGVNSKSAPRKSAEQERMYTAARGMWQGVLKEAGLRLEGEKRGGANNPNGAPTKEKDAGNPAPVTNAPGRPAGQGAGPSSAPPQEKRIGHLAPKVETNGTVVAPELKTAEEMHTFFSILVTAAEGAMKKNAGVANANVTHWQRCALAFTKVFTETVSAIKAEEEALAE